MMRAALLTILGGLLFSGGYALAGLDVPPAQPDLSGYVSKSEMPGAATTAPPATQTDSTRGTSERFAREDHTHATSVQRTRVQVSPSGQPVRWPFAKPYEAGVIPVVTCTAQNNAGSSRPFVVNTVGDPTNMEAWIVVYQAAQPTISLLGIQLTLFASAPPGTLVNCQAAKATQ